jgi:hypothetical protein
MRLMSETVIGEQVARGLEKSLPRLKELNRSALGFFVDTLWAKACRNRLQNGDLSFRMYCFANE